MVPEDLKESIPPDLREAVTGNPTARKLFLALIEKDLAEIKKQYVLEGYNPEEVEQFLKEGSEIALRQRGWLPPKEPGEKDLGLQPK